jgi:glutaredoxin
MKYIDSNEALMEEFRTVLPDAKTVPQIFLNEDDGFHQYIGGYTDLVEYFRTHS